METYSDLACNFSKRDRVAVEETWKELATLLNAEGPHQKN